MLKHAFRNLLVCFDKQLNVNDIFRWQSLSCEDRLPKGFESILADLITLSFSKSPCQDPAGFSTLVHPKCRFFRLSLFPWRRVFRRERHSYARRQE